MARTGVYYQWARGRAMVRNQCMRKARAKKQHLVRGTNLWTGLPLLQSEREALQSDIRALVARARLAHRFWREYRNSHLEVEL